MKIYTSYFYQVRHLPDDIVPISIARGTPSWFKGKEYKSLAPSWGLLDSYKAGEITQEKYIEEYRAECLDLLDFNIVVKELEELSGGKDIALMCVENPLDFCHRHLSFKDFKNVGYYVIEWRK